MAWACGFMLLSPVPILRHRLRHLKATPFEKISPFCRKTFQEGSAELQFPRLRSEPVTFVDLSCFLHIQPVVFTPPTNRHPERSPSQIGRVTQRLWGEVEEPVLSVAEGTSAAFN